jgi:GAF domain-containing protein/HAMP domain-containing protein
MTRSDDYNIEKSVTRSRSSLLQRITLLGLIMAMLVAAAGAISFRFARGAENDMDIMNQAAHQAVQISEMQSSWLSVVGTLDTISITRPAEGVKEKLDQYLADLDQKLETLADTQIGFSSATIAENQTIATELRGVGSEVGDLANEIYSLSEQGRWGTALQRRQGKLAELQARLDNGLERLNSNLQGELAARGFQAQRRQEVTRLLSLTAVSLAFVIALGVAWLGRQSIVKPLQVLIRDVNRITSGDFNPVTPMSRSDEIGDLSRSVALMTAWLNDSYEAMEARVNERTVEIQRRTVQLQVAAQIARDVAATSNLDELLISAVELIRERFGFYHAGIFLIDARGDYAVLRAATGEAGREMLKIEHKLSIGGTSEATGLVGHAVAKREAQLARDVDQDPFHFKNPYLPDTRSELVLPLIAAEQIIGVLDVQSQIPDAFDQESITILQVMADQLAIAIQNARLLQEVHENLYELQAAYGRIERQEWSRLAKTYPVIGFEFNGIEVTPISRNVLSSQSRLDLDSPTIAQESSQLMEEGETSIQEDIAEKQTASAKSSRNEIKPISIPLQVRGEKIGSLEVWPQSDHWSETEAYLLTTISSRLSQVLEGARLLQQAQNLASREQQINLIANQMRSASNLDAILKNTVRELGKALGARRAYIQLGEIKGKDVAGALELNSSGEDGPDNTTPGDGNSGVSRDGQ